jgi:hypothetical protein
VAKRQQRRKRFPSSRSNRQQLKAFRNPAGRFDVLSAPPVQNLIGVTLWGIAAGEGTGPLVTLHFGDKLPRLRPLDNPTLAPDLRTHEGEFVLFIKCRWTIEHNKHKLADDGSSPRPGGAMQRALRRLLNRPVKEVNFRTKAVSVEFTGHLGLHIYPQTQTNGLGNYSFSTPEQRFAVTDDLHVDMKARRR